MGYELQAEPETPAEYEKPMVVDYGDLIELTAGGTTGGALDATFQAGTAYGKLTFS